MNQAANDLVCLQLLLPELERELRFGWWELGEELHVSPGLARLYAEEPEALNLSRWLAAHLLPERRGLAEALERGEPFELSLRTCDPEGSIRDLRVIGRRGPGGLCGWVLDRTHLRLERQRAAHLASWAIQGRTHARRLEALPDALTTVLGYLDLLERRSGGCPLVAEAQKGAQRLHELLADLPPSLPSPYDVTPVLRSMRFSSLHLEAPLPRARGSSSALAAVLRELSHITAPVTAFPTSSPLSASARRRGNKLIIRLEEDPADALSPTLQTSLAASDDLAWCRLALEREGACLSHSIARGRRWFQLELPTDDGPPELPADPEPLPLLLVEDEPLVGALLQRQLHDQLARDVQLVGSAAEALAEVQSRRWDAIVCDLSLPDMSGCQLHAELERIEPDLSARILFITGGALTGQAEEFLSRLPPWRVLYKPFELTQLVERLRTLPRAE